MDEAPKEILLFTIYGVKLRLQKWIENRETSTGVSSGIFENLTKLKFQMAHMQIDNMSDSSMPVILIPTRPIEHKVDFTSGSELLASKKSPYRA